MSKRFYSVSSVFDPTKRIHRIALNSPPVNALDTNLLTELQSHLLQIHQNSGDIRGILFYSQNPKVTSSNKVFSAGLNLKTLVKPTATPKNQFERQIKDSDFKSSVSEYMKLFTDCVRLMLTLPKPTVAVVQGAAPAGGTVLSLCCDYRLGVPGLQMGLTEVAVGMAPPLWVHQLARNHMSNREATLAVSRGTLYKHDEALNVGFVDRLVEDFIIFEEAEKEIDAIAKLPPVAWYDAKLKANDNVLNLLNDVALEQVVESISGPEFQSIANGILQSLSRKK